MATPKKKMGAPLKYDRVKILDEIFRRIEDGESNRKICSGSDGMPSYDLFKKWMRENPDLITQYAHSKQLSAEAFEEKAIATAEDDTDDIIFVECETKDGITSKRVINHEAINRSRLKVDTYKWVASKRDPKKYGDKLGLDGALSGKFTVQWDE